MDKIFRQDVINDYLQEMKKIDVNQNLNDMIWPFCLSTELWENYENRKSVIDLQRMRKIKYFEGEQLSDDIDAMPADKGGIYIYMIQNPVIPDCGTYIMYVGRARKTANQNLRNRAKSHYSQYIRHEENERLERLFDHWKKYLYLLYLPIEGNDEIDLAEDELILALAPPCNKKYPSPKIRRKLSKIFY